MSVKKSIAPDWVIAPTFSDLNIADGETPLPPSWETAPDWETAPTWEGSHIGGTESYYYYKKQKTRTKQAQPPSIDQKIPVKRSLEQVIAESKKLGVLPADK